jgi:hypothetical protein
MKKKKILLGVIVELITYIPFVFLVILFRKTKSNQKRSKNTKKTLQIDFIDDFKSKSKESSENVETKNSFKFPWFFKIILYSISLGIIGFSNLFVLFKGNSQTFI